VDPAKFDNSNKAVGKVGAIWEALKLIGMGWVAIDIASYRPRWGKKFDEAKKFYERNGWKRSTKPLPTITKINIEDRIWSPIEDEEVDRKLNCNGENYSNQDDGDLNFVIVKNGCKDNECLFPDSVAQSIKFSLERTGMVVIRGAVDKPTIEQLRGRCDEKIKIKRSHPDAAKIKENGSRKGIRNTTGNGMAGEAIYAQQLTKKTKLIGSLYSTIMDSVYLNRLQRIIVSSLKDRATTTTTTTTTTITTRTTSSKRKCIKLVYSKGGENWAHRDNNSDGYFEYQALLMLSNSNEYDGGEFYVAKRCDSEESNFNGNGNNNVNVNGEKIKIKIIRACCPKLDAGDLVIFRADKKGGYDHGMKKVTKGERIAVGLLQPK
jgi:hypothetical protein